jgi:uncharacterized protein YdhG (YjbR/CyaY superfamily)
MPLSKVKPNSIDEYIAAFPPEVQTILEQIRLTVRQAAPDAEETISYQIPAFKQATVLVYFAAFKNHIGFYPPITGSPSLARQASRYAGEKGNLKFPLDQPVPCDLITKIVKLRLRQNQAKTSAKTKN